MNKISTKAKAAPRAPHLSKPLRFLLGFLFASLGLYVLTLAYYSMVSSDLYNTGTITVNGHGEAVVKPDIRRVSITISPEVVAVTSTSTKKTSTTTIDNYKKVLSYLKGKGVQDVDIQKVSSTQILAKLRGKNTTTPNTIRMELEKISTKITATVGDLEVENPDAAKNQALEAALNDAKMSAFKVCRSLGARLGKVTTYYENQPYRDSYAGYEEENQASSSNSVTTDISVTYQIR